jgi:tetratricopeptide (TPR) repeat protein
MTAGVQLATWCTNRQRDVLGSADVKDERLDSWKAISQYLGRGLRTVQRWHCDYGMPVHRVNRHSGSVFAFVGELDGWLRSRSEDDLLPDLSPVKREASKNVSKGALTDSVENLEWQLSDQNAPTLLQQYRHAIDLDPLNVELHAALSHLQMVLGLTYIVPTAIAYPRAVNSVATALRINSANPSALVSLALNTLVWKQDWRAAWTTYLSLPKARYVYKSLIGRALLKVVHGQLLDAETFLREAVEAAPFNVPLVSLLLLVLYYARQYDEVMFLAEAYRRSGESGALFCAVEALSMIQMARGDAGVHGMDDFKSPTSNGFLANGIRGYRLALTGRREAALEVLRHLEDGAQKRMDGASYVAALINLALDHREQAVRWLEASYRERSIWSLAFHLDPVLENLSDYMPFMALNRTIGYPGMALEQKIYSEATRMPWPTENFL